MTSGESSIRLFTVGASRRSPVSVTNETPSRSGGVAAKDTLEYDIDERRAVARGAAEVDAAEGRISAAAIEARFGEDRELATARAWGGVTIRTARETVRAREAEYDARTGRAVAKGDVRIQRGQNILTGAVATVDLKSGISRIQGPGKR